MDRMDLITKPVFVLYDSRYNETQFHCNVTGASGQVADCSDPNKIQCELNYFLFQNQDIQHCVICPYQDYTDPLTLYCMDCVEHPYTWNQNRQCTYDYQILNGNADHGVYTRVNRSTRELYYVDLSKNSPFAPITYLCDGCQEFCFSTTSTNNSIDCNTLINIHEAYDPGHSSIICLNGYFADSVAAICSSCMASCQNCVNISSCLIASTGSFLNQHPTLSSPLIQSCQSQIPFCEVCSQDSFSPFILRCLQCQKTSSGLQYILSLDLQLCVLCEAYCSRCEFTTYDVSISLYQNFLIYPTRYLYTNPTIQTNSLSYLKRCRQCSNKDYIVSPDGIKCIACSIQNCQQCYYSYTVFQGDVPYAQTTLDLDFTPTNTSVIQQCQSCQANYVLSPQKDYCQEIQKTNITLIPFCSTYYNITNTDESTNTTKTTTTCSKCQDTFFYNVNSKLCQVHDPNEQILANYNLVGGVYVQSVQSQIEIDNLINGLAFITCSTYLSNCLECYMYQSFDFILDSITRPYLYQCVRCVDGYYADYFSGMCLLCKTVDQPQNCQSCSQYSITLNYTDYLSLYPSSFNSKVKSVFQRFYTPFTKPMCHSCFKGFTFFNSISDCDACGSNCYTNSCQNLQRESYCYQCWPPLPPQSVANLPYTQRSLTNDNNECFDCPDFCEACRDRTLEEKISVNIDFKPVSALLNKYGRFCYKPTVANFTTNADTYAIFYDSILGMPLQCTNTTNGCKHSTQIDIQLFCSQDDYYIAKFVNPSPKTYSLQSLYSSSFGAPTLSFGGVDFIEAYLNFNSQVIQELFFNINFIQPSDPSQMCTMSQETNLEIYIQQNVFSLKNLVVTLQGSATFNNTYVDQNSNTIIALSSTLNILFLRNIGIKGLTFIYPLDCSLTTKTKMAIDNAVYVWGIKLKQNQLTQLLMINSTFGADAAYLNKMNFTNLFSTNDKLLFQFTMNNVYNLTILDVRINYNNYTYMKNTNPLTRTFDANVSSLAQRITYIDGLFIKGLGLYGTPLFLANDIPTTSQQIIIGAKGLNFKFCNFYAGSHIFSELPSSLTNSGQVNISRLVIQQSTFVQSSIFYLALNINNGTFISNVDIIGCNFTDGSYAFHMNNFKLSKIYTYMLNMSNHSSIIKTQSIIPEDTIIIQNSLNQQMTQLHFSYTICQTAGCLIQLTSPSNILNLKTNVTINGIILDNTNIDGVNTVGLTSISTALIQILDVGTIVMANLYSDNNLAVAILFVDQVNIVKFYDFMFDWSDAVAYESLNLTDSSLSNSLMPITIACLQTKVAARQFNNIQIFIDSFMYGVYMQNITMQNLLSLDNRFIYITSYNILKFNTSVIHPLFLDYRIQDTIFKTTEAIFLPDNSSEIINIVGCRFINNRLVISKTDALTSIFYIQSEQQQIISFIYCLFQSNHLHQLAPFQSVPSATCITIESQGSSVAILTSNFTGNAATQIQYGIIYIVSNQTVFSQSRFLNTSIYDDTWQARLQPNNLNSSQFEYFFFVISTGGNAYINSFTTKILLSTFNYSRGRLGTGIYFKTLGIGNISIEYSTFVNQIANLELTQSSIGGALYVDSSSSSLILNIQDTRMNKCYARVMGGCIYVYPSVSNQQIKIKRSQFSNCYAILTSFMVVTFISTQGQYSVEFDEVRIYQELYGLQGFFRQIPNFNQNDALISFQYYGWVYYQSFGTFNFINSIIENIYYAGCLYLTDLNQINIKDVKIQDSIPLIASIITILQPTMNGQIVFQNLVIRNINSNNPDGLSQSCISQPTIITNQDGISCLEANDTIQNNSLIQSTEISNTSSLINSTCLNDSTVFYNQIFTDPFQVYYGTLDFTQKYGFSDEIQDSVLSDLNQLSYRDDLYNYESTIDEEIQFNTMASSYLNCLLGTLTTNSNSDVFGTALISISLNYGTQVNITSLTIQNNHCRICFGGLVQLKMVFSTPGQPKIRMFDITCTNNTSGHYGCLSFTPDRLFYQQGADYYGSLSSITQRVLTYYDEKSNPKGIERILQNDTIKSGLLHQDLDIYLENIILTSNIAFFGAGITIFNLNSLIVNAQFQQNIAKQVGAGLFFYNYRKYQIFIYNSSFSGNQAQAGGAIMLVKNKLGDTSLWNIKFSDNNATVYAANIAEPPQSLSIQIVLGQTIPIKTFLNYSGDRDSLGNVKNSTVLIKDLVFIKSYMVKGYAGMAKYLILPSGQTIQSYQHYHKESQEWVPFNYIFRVVNLDKQFQKNQNVAANDVCTVSGRRQSTSFSKIYNDSNPFYSNYTNMNQFQYSINKGAYDFDDMIIYFSPYLPSTEYLQLRFQCTSVIIPIYSVYPPYNITDYNINYVLYLNVQTFPCQFGEYRSSLLPVEDVRCLICQSGSETFSVDPNIFGCRPIDRQTMLNVTSSMIQVQPGFWRPYDDDANIEPCYNYISSCLGGWQTGQTSCHEGHIGALCESCDLKATRTGESWAQSAPYLCGRCSELLAQNMQIIVGISVLTLISIIASVSGNQEVVENFIRNQVLSSMGVLVKATESSLAILIKIFTNYFQIITAISTFQLSLPPAFSDTVANIGNPIKSMQVSYDCFFLTISTIEILYFRVIWSIALPFIYLCMFFFGYFVAVLLKKTTYKKSIIYTTFIYMFIYLQPTLLGGLMSVLSVRTVSSYAWVQADVSYRSDTSIHRLWIDTFIAPNLALWACIIPIGLLMNLRRHRETLNSQHTRVKWGYFYNEYRLSAFFWEFIKIFQKELIIIFLIFFQDDIVVKGLLIFFMIFIYGALAIHVKPYQSSTLNLLDMESTVVCAVSMSGGALCYAAAANGLNGLALLLLIVISAINILFIAQMIGVLLINYVYKFAEHIDKLRVKILEKRPNLAEEYPFLRKYLIVHADMRLRILYLWGILRYETRQGIKRQRINKLAPLILIRPMREEKEQCDEEIQIKPDEEIVIMNCGFWGTQNNLNLILGEDLVPQVDKKSPSKYSPSKNSPSKNSPSKLSPLNININRLDQDVQSSQMSPNFQSETDIFLEEDNLDEPESLNINRIRLGVNNKRFKQDTIKEL